MSNRKKSYFQSKKNDERKNSFPSKEKYIKSKKTRSLPKKNKFIRMLQYKFSSDNGAGPCPFSVGSGSWLLKSLWLRLRPSAQHFLHQQPQRLYFRGVYNQD